MRAGFASPARGSNAAPRRRRSPPRRDMRPRPAISVGPELQLEARINGRPRRAVAVNLLIFLIQQIFAPDVKLGAVRNLIGCAKVDERIITECDGTHRDGEEAVEHRIQLRRVILTAEIDILAAYLQQ